MTILNAIIASIGRTALQAAPGRSRGMLPSIVRGFPITVGLAAAFVILLVTVPVLRIVSVLRGNQDSCVPLVTTASSYRVAANVVADTLGRHGLQIEKVEPPWWSALPTRVLRRVGRGAFASYVAEDVAYFRGRDLEVTRRYSSRASAISRASWREIPSGSRSGG